MYENFREQAVFQLEDDLLIPGVLASGPRYPNSLHGSVMIAAMARAAELYPSEIKRQVSRLTVDMMIAAPKAPLKTEVNVTKSGRNVEFLDIKLTSQGTLFLKGSAMRIRVEPVQVDEYFKGIGPYPGLPNEQENDIFQFPNADEPAYHHAIDMRLDEHEDKPVIWFKLAVPLVENETTTPFQKLACASDWTYAVPNIVHKQKNNIPFHEQNFSGINPDTTINFFRPPVGDWIGLKSEAAYGVQGSGCAAAILLDEQGPIGFSSQSVLLREFLSDPRNRQEAEGFK